MTFRFTTLLSLFGIACAPAAVDFEKQILPILEQSCFECHSAAVKKPKGKISFDTAEALAEVAEDTEWDWVLELVKMPKGDPDIMPPEDKGTPLEKNQIALLETWINEGASIGNFSKYDHPEKQLVSGLGKKKLASEIKAAAAELDAVVEKSLEKGGLKRNPEISDTTFLRRAYLELAGRNPTVAEAERFLKTDNPDKRALLVEYLSDSDAYVSRHFNYWVKVFRGDSKQGGNEQDAWFHYLKKSIAENTHYDEWTREMMMAEGRMWDDPAIGFYQRDAKNRLAGYEAMTNVFLGTDIGCAQCHDHPTEPMSQLSYFKMNAFYEASHPFGEGRGMFEHLGKSEYVESLRERQKYVKENRIHSRDRAARILSLGFRSTYEFRKQITAEDNTGRSKVPDTYRYDDVKHGDHLEPEPMFGMPPEIKKGDKPMFVFAEWVTDPQNLKFTHTIANRMWLKIMGAPVLGSPTDIINPEDSDFPELAEHIAELMLACDYDLKKFQAILLNTRTFQSESVPAENTFKDFAFQGPVLHRLSAEQIWDSMLTLIDKNVDPGPAPTPNFDFYLQARNAKTAEEYWKLVEKRLDYELENNVGIIGGFGASERSKATTSRGGYDPDYLVRASELPSPAPDGHFLQIFGQGQRVQIEDQWDTATIPQALMLLNGDLHSRIASEDSVVYTALSETDDHVQSIGKVYLAALARYPDKDELALAKEVTGDATMGSYFHLLWILMNTTEFVLQS